MTLKLTDYHKRVMDIIRIYDLFDQVFWDKEFTFYIICNDIFYWGTADAEDITRSDVKALEQAMIDVEAVGDDVKNKAKEDGQRISAVEGTDICGGLYGHLLFVARKRNERPQGAVYVKFLPKPLWPLFDEAGVYKEVGLGNPYPHPIDDKEQDYGNYYNNDNSWKNWFDLFKRPITNLKTNLNKHKE